MPELLPDVTECRLEGGPRVLCRKSCQFNLVFVIVRFELIWMALKLGILLSNLISSALSNHH